MSLTPLTLDHERDLYVIRCWFEIHEESNPAELARFICRKYAGSLNHLKRYGAMSQPLVDRFLDALGRSYEEWGGSQW